MAEQYLMLRYKYAICDIDHLQEIIHTDFEVFETLYSLEKGT